MAIYCEEIRSEFLRKHRISKFIRFSIISISSNKKSKKDCDMNCVRLIMLLINRFIKSHVVWQIVVWINWKILYHNDKKSDMLHIHVFQKKRLLFECTHIDIECLALSILSGVSVWSAPDESCRSRFYRDLFAYASLKVYKHVLPQHSLK